MKTKAERHGLHRSQIRDKNSLFSKSANIANNRAQYVSGLKGLYKNIKIDGSNFYIKLETDKE